MRFLECLTLMVSGALAATVIGQETQNGPPETKTVDVHRESSSSEDLKAYIDKRLEDIEKSHSNMMKKMSTLEDTLSKLERDFSRFRDLSELGESLRDLEAFTRQEWQSIKSEFLPCIERLEDASAVCEGVTQIRTTLDRHGSDIAALQSQTVANNNSCDTPPNIENGYPVTRSRRHGATMKYACLNNGTLIEKGAVTCHFGKWVGALPQCMKGCDANDLRSYEGVELPPKRIHQHAEVMQVLCRHGYVPSFPGALLCWNGLWDVKKAPCIEGYFDPTFVLRTPTHSGAYMSCISAENYQITEFSRVLDTGLGTGLPKNAKRSIEDNKSVLTLFGSKDEEGVGAFQCGFQREYGSMNITVLAQPRSKEELVALTPFIVANIGDEVEMRVNVSLLDGLPPKVDYSTMFYSFDLPIQWMHNGEEISPWEHQLLVKIRKTQLRDAGIYESFYEGRRNQSLHAFFRLIVRKCKANLYGEKCDQECPPCYNGGVCHDHLGICVCPAGFTGPSCEVACGGGLFGDKCSEECFSNRGKETCRLNYFCKPDPLGCTCAPGYGGLTCKKKCEPGWYGADCKQPCHCANGPENCDRFTGACEGGCAEGWTGGSCQIQKKDIN